MYIRRWKVHLVAYNFVADFIRLAVVVATKICEITRNSEKIRTYSSSRSSKGHRPWYQFESAYATSGSSSSFCNVCLSSWSR